VERSTLAGQQPAPDALSNQLAMQKEDLKLTAAPGARRVDMDN
jgi:hypothetical protein